MCLWCLSPSSFAPPQNVCMAQGLVSFVLLFRALSIYLSQSLSHTSLLLPLSYSVSLTLSLVPLSYSVSLTSASLTPLIPQSSVPYLRAVSCVVDLSLFVCLWCLCDRCRLVCVCRLSLGVSCVCRLSLGVSVVACCLTRGVSLVWCLWRASL